MAHATRNDARKKKEQQQCDNNQKKSKEDDVIEIEATVLDSLPNAMFHVSLDGGPESQTPVLATISGKIQLQCLGYKCCNHLFCFWSSLHETLLILDKVRQEAISEDLEIIVHSTGIGPIDPHHISSHDAQANFIPNSTLLDLVTVELRTILRLSEVCAINGDKAVIPSILLKSILPDDLSIKNNRNEILLETESKR